MAYERGNEDENIEEFKKLSYDEIQDWFKTVKRPMTSKEKHYSNLAYERALTNFLREDEERLPRISFIQNPKKQYETLSDEQEMGKNLL